MRKLLTRTVVGVAYVAVMVAGTMLRPWTLLLLVLTLTALAVHELAHIVSTGCGLMVNRSALACSALFFPLATFFSCTLTEVNVLLLFVPWLATLLFFFIFEVGQNHPNHIGNLGLMSLVQLYVVVPLSILLVLAVGPVSAQTVDEPFWLFPLGTYIFLWLDDSGAYLIGSLLGRHKLAPKISPGKTWEGAAGGWVLTMVAAIVMARLFPCMGIGKWMGMAIVVVVFGTFGDLTESLIKRQLGLKDSGRMLPGHGGILDRIDSMLLALPAVLVYLVLCGLA